MRFYTVTGILQATVDLEARSAAAQRDLTALETKQQYVNDMLAESQKVCISN
jgi:hypothetical protein